MRLCFLASADSIHSVRWIKYFQERGHEIHWISLVPPIKEAGELIKEVDFHEIRPSPLPYVNGVWAWLYMPRAMSEVKKIIASAKPDLLHVQSAGNYGIVAALSGFHPLVLTPWGSDILLNIGIKKFLVRYVVGRADYFTCDGENTRAKLIELGADPKKIELIRFGVEMEKFPSKSSGIQNQKSKVVIISLRSLISLYDIETLVRATKLAIKETPNIQVLIAGDGEQRNYLEKLSHELGLSETVQFTGRYKSEDLPAILQATDIYVSTALSDSGLSASTAEAMASGLPAVVTDTGDNRKWVMENKGGFIVPVKDPATLADKLLYLTKNEQDRIAFGKYNRRVIEDKNNYRKEMAKMEKIYEKVASLN